MGKSRNKGKNNPMWKGGKYKKCRICGKKFWEYPSQSRKYCSRECYYKSKVGKHHSEETKQKISKALKGRSRDPEVIEKVAKKNRKLKLSKTKLKNLYWEKELSLSDIGEKYDVTPKTVYNLMKKYNIPRRDYSEAIKGEKCYWYGKHLSSSHRKKLSKAKEKYYKEDSKHLKKVLNIRKPTSLEKRIINLIEEYNLPFKYVGDGDFILGGKNPDFVDTDGSKRIIEVFGDYWHEPEEEQERKELFSKYGFDTLILWGHDIHNLPEKKVVDKIKAFGGKNG